MPASPLVARLLATAPSVGLAVCRCALGLSMAWHGYEKLLPPAHGPGHGALAGLQYFAAFVVQLGLPSWLGYLSVFTEFLGGLLVLAGLFTRLAAGLIFVNMTVALVTVNLKHGLASSEYTLALIAIALALVLSGAGAFSVDRRLARIV